MALVKNAHKFVLGVHCAAIFPFAAIVPIVTGFLILWLAFVHLILPNKLVLME